MAVNCILWFDNIQEFIKFVRKNPDVVVKRFDMDDDGVVFVTYQLSDTSAQALYEIILANNMSNLK